MKNKISCSNCGTENAIYAVSCSKCNSFLRKRTINIDFWQTVWRILYSPVDTAVNIIRAEHKNFTLVFFFLILLKLFLLKISTVYIINEYSDFSQNIFGAFVFQVIQISIAFLLILFVFVKINKLFKLDTRFKDNFALLVFSFTPLLFSLIILTPVEYALFGKFWFFGNPFPVFIKPTAAYMLYSLELLMVVWSFIIYIAALFAQSRNWIYSIIFGAIIFSSLFVAFYFL